MGSQKPPAGIAIHQFALINSRVSHDARLFRRRNETKSTNAVTGIGWEPKICNIIIFSAGKSQDFNFRILAAKRRHGT